MSEKKPVGLVKRIAKILIVLWVVYESYLWGICRIYVGPSQMLVLTAKFGDPLPSGSVLADPGQKGIQKQVYGEGRHFFSPVFYKREIRDAFEIGPTEVGVIISKVGTELAAGEFLADEGQQGIQKKVLTPGRYRINPYGYEVRIKPATIIKPGYVGVVTALSGKEPSPGKLSEAGQRGIQRLVLQPGLYYMNPEAFKVEPVEVGYRELTKLDISFPSADGFPINLDTTVVWGLIPDNAPMALMHFGNIPAIIAKVIEPQLMSICRIEGSKNRAQDFIEGEKREAFQNAFTKRLKTITAEKQLDTQIALVRSIEVPDSIRAPIQDTKVAVEVQLTKAEQIKSQQVYNELEQLKAEVQKGIREVAATTEKMVAEAQAKGEANIAKIEADTAVKVAEIQRQVAELAADKNRKLGKADADVEEMLQAARADRFTQSVQALGSPTAYANYTFVSGLSNDLEIVLRYAGDGTFWTDLNSSKQGPQELAGMKILENSSKPSNK